MKGLKTTPLKPNNFLGRIPYSLRFRLNLISIKKIVHIHSTTSKGAKSTELENFKFRSKDIVTKSQILFHNCKIG